MRKHTGLIVGFLLLAAFAGFAGWAVFAVSDRGSGLAGLVAVWPYVVGGMLAVSVFTAVFIALAVHAARVGYDDRIEPD